MAVKQGKLTIENLTGGIQKDFVVTSNIGVKTSTPNAYTSGQMNVTKPGFVGDMSAPPSISVVSSSMNGYPIQAVQVQNGTCYFLTDQARLYKLTTGNVLSLVTSLGGDVANGLGGNALYGDMWTHIDGSGNEVVLISLYRSSPGNWAIASMDTATETITPIASWFNGGAGISGAQATYYHRGVVGPANKSYVLNGGNVDTYNPVTNTYTQSAVVLGTGWMAKGLCNFGNYVAIVGSRGNSESRLWLWDGSSTNVNFSYDIRDFNATSVINDSGVLKIMCYGKSGTLKIKTFTGTEVSENPLWEQSSTTFGISPEQYSIGMYYNQMFWMNPAGDIMSYGSPDKTRFYEGAHKFLSLSTSYNATSGMGLCKNVKQNRLYFGYTTASGGTLAYTDMSGYDATLSIGNFRTALYELPVHASINVIKIYPSYWNTFSYLTPRLYRTGAPSVEQLALSTPVVQYTDQNILDYYPIKKTVQDVQAFAFDLTFAACAIRKIEIFYSYEDGNI